MLSHLAIEDWWYVWSQGQIILVRSGHALTRLVIRVKLWTICGSVDRCTCCCWRLTLWAITNGKLFARVLQIWRCVDTIVNKRLFFGKGWSNWKYTHKEQAKHHTIFFSLSGKLSIILLNENLLRSIEWLCPSSMISLTALPTAGDCWIPCPLNPVAKTKFVIIGWAPIIPFWSNVL